MGKLLANPRRCGCHLGKVDRAVCFGRSTDCDEDDVRSKEGVVVLGEGQVSSCNAALQERWKPLLVNGCFPSVEPRNATGVYINSDDFEFRCETRGCAKTGIA